MAESVRAKLYGNDSFGDVAHAVYEKFEGKIIPEEFVGSAQYVNNFIKGSFGENAGLDKVETCIAKTVDIGEDFLANMNAVSGIVGYGIKKAFRAAGDDRGYGLDKLIHDEEPKVRLLAYDALRAEEEQQKSNQQGKRCVLFVQDNYDDEIENSEFDFDV